jgi:hypothetical protein
MSKAFRQFKNFLVKIIVTNGENLILGEKLTNLTFQLLQVETSNSLAFRPTRIEILTLLEKVSDSSGFYFWPI